LQTEARKFRKAHESQSYKEDQNDRQTHCRENAKENKSDQRDQKRLKQRLQQDALDHEVWDRTVAWTPVLSGDANGEVAGVWVLAVSLPGSLNMARDYFQPASWSKPLKNEFWEP
jgi:hypothetical protein